MHEVYGSPFTLTSREARALRTGRARPLRFVLRTGSALAFLTVGVMRRAAPRHGRDGPGE